MLSGGLDKQWKISGNSVVRKTSNVSALAQRSDVHLAYSTINIVSNSRRRVSALKQTFIITWMQSFALMQQFGHIALRLTAIQYK